MNILICGGAGYIGSHALRLLRNEGYNCQVVDNLSTGHEWAVSGSPLHVVDILDTAALERVFKKGRIDAVMHFCALSLVGESCEKPDRYYRNNVVGTLNLLDAMCRHQVDQLIFSSTAAVFGNPESEVISESHPKNPLNPYGKSKLMIEQLLLDYQSALGLNSISLRYFNAAGADTSGEIGEAHDPETHLIPNIIKSVLAEGHAAPLKVFGSDYETRDGTCIRDYIHVNDIARAHLLALDYLQQNPGCHYFNLGSRTGYSVLEVIQACEQALSQSIPYEIAGRRAGDPAILVADNRLAQQQLGWEPSQSNLSTIIATAVNWERCKSGNKSQAS